MEQQNIYTADRTHKTKLFVNRAPGEIVYVRESVREGERGREREGAE